jgi:hypothetical protein
MIYRLTTYSPKGFYLAFGSGTPFGVNRWGRETCSAQWRRNVGVCVRCFLVDFIGGEGWRRGWRGGVQTPEMQPSVV